MMPSKKAHADKTLHNVAFVCMLDEQPRFHDWAATGAFYAALHAAEALFAGRSRPPKHCTNHEHREHELKSERRYQHIWKHYRPLQHAATVARYMKNVETFSNYLSPDDVRSTLLKDYLTQVLKSAQKMAKTAEAKKAFCDSLGKIAAL